MAEKVLISPERLVYVGPFDEPRVCELRLVNPTEQPVMFKMKSTRPDRFKIRPVYGYVDAGGGSSLVRVVCRPFDDSAGIPTKDRVTAVLLQVPGVVGRSSLVWKNMSPTEMRGCRRVALAVTYVKILKQQPQRSERRLQLMAKKVELLKQLQQLNDELGQGQEQQQPTGKRPKLYEPEQQQQPIRAKQRRSRRDEEEVEPEPPRRKPNVRSPNDSDLMRPAKVRRTRPVNKKPIRHEEDDTSHSAEDSE